MRLLSENLMGTWHKALGVKEQALPDNSVNTAHSNKLKTMWIDAKKAFDYVEHEYLPQCITKLKVLQWILAFLSSILA